MTISATELKQKSHLLENVKREDIVVTKRDRPFAVIMDIDRYRELVRRVDERGLEAKRRILRESAGILEGLPEDPVKWQRKIRDEERALDGWENGR
jgi:prevent-host-death family protein